MAHRLVLALPILFMFSICACGDRGSKGSSVDQSATRSASTRCGTVLDCAQAAVQAAADASAAAERATAAFPPGTVVAFAGEDLPTGWLWCDGNIVSRSDYSRLYAVIKETYGRGDGKTNFGLPDYRGKFLRGVDQQGIGGMSEVDKDRHDKKLGLGSTQEDENKHHHHDAYLVKYNEVALQVEYQHYDALGVSPNPVLRNGKGSVEEFGGTESRPVNVAVHWMIKY